MSEREIKTMLEIKSAAYRMAFRVWKNSGCPRGPLMRAVKVLGDERQQLDKKLFDMRCQNAKNLL